MKKFEFIDGIINWDLYVDGNPVICGFREDDEYTGETYFELDRFVRKFVEEISSGYYEELYHDENDTQLLNLTDEEKAALHSVILKAMAKKYGYEERLTMTKAEFVSYLNRNFHLSDFEHSLIKNILNYVEKLSSATDYERTAILHSLLDDTIGLDKEEIDAVRFVEK